ncbi:MAG: hypothetical protein DMF13_04280, partial [Verrucomicrobia bacterium]
MRERGESPPRAGRGATKRDRAAAGSRREPFAPDETIPDRKCTPGHAGRSGRFDLRGGGSPDSKDI